MGNAGEEGGHPAAVDGQGVARDVARQVGDQEERRLADLVGGAPALGGDEPWRVRSIISGVSGMRGVMMLPGAMALTRMSWGDHSTAMVRTRFIRPAFAAP